MIYIMNWFCASFFYVLFLNSAFCYVYNNGWCLFWAFYYSTSDRVIRQRIDCRMLILHVAHIGISKEIEIYLQNNIICVLFWRAIVSLYKANPTENPTVQYTSLHGFSIYSRPINVIAKCYQPRFNT